MNDKKIAKSEQPVREDKKELKNFYQSEESPIIKRQEMLSEIDKELDAWSPNKGNIEDVKTQKEKEVAAQIREIETTIPLSEESKAQIISNNINIPIRALMEEQEKKYEMKKLKDILEYVQRELPDTELRIKKPMRKDCKVAVSIPAYEEGVKILDSLEFLANQDGVFKDEYEVIVNVNNRKGAKANTIKLNQQTLNILKFLNGEPVDISFLSDKEKEKVQKLKESGLVVHYIDKTTPGNEIELIDDEDFRKVGCMQPRKRTMDEICERFALIKKIDGIIASLDADTKVNKNWIKRIINTFNNKDIQLLAGERRDGLDINSEGALINRDQVIEKLLDQWNTEERKNDEVFKELPDIRDRLQRAQIFLMNHLINTYNKARSQFHREQEGVADIIKNFRGGSGKIFRVETYIKNPLAIIKMMDADGGKPVDIDEDSFKYIGRTKSKDIELTTKEPEIEALAVYPETRIRSWGVNSENSKDSYCDFKDIHKPFGSSGKEYAYAIVAVLKKKIPTTYNEEAEDIKKLLERYIVDGKTKEVRQKLKKFFDQGNIEQIDKITADDIEKLKIGDPAVVDKHKEIVDRIKEMSNQRVSIIDALRFYGTKNPEEKIDNPERYFLEILVKEMIQSKRAEKEKIKNIIKENYSLDEDLIEQLAGLQSREELSRFFQDNSDMQKVLANIPRRVSYTEAADKYEKLMRF